MIAEFTAPEATANDAELLISHPFTCSRGTGEARVGLLFAHDDKVDRCGAVEVAALQQTVWYPTETFWDRVNRNSNGA